MESFYEPVLDVLHITPSYAVGWNSIMWPYLCSLHACQRRRGNGFGEQPDGQEVAEPGFESWQSGTRIPTLDHRATQSSIVLTLFLFFFQIQNSLLKYTQFLSSNYTILKCFPTQKNINDCTCLSFQFTHSMLVHSYQKHHYPVPEPHSNAGRITSFSTPRNILISSLFQTKNNVFLMLLSQYLP